MVCWVCLEGQYTTQDDLTAIEVARVFRDDNYEDTTWGKAAATISGAIEEETTRDLEFKQAAINEAEYAAGRGSSNVQFRHNDRDLRNKSLNPLSDSWDQGWIGVKESAYGFLNLLGETSENEWLSEVGEAGVRVDRLILEEIVINISQLRIKLFLILPHLI